MEFFATIGLITVIWLIYDFTKYVFIDYDKEKEEEDESTTTPETIQSAPDSFDLEKELNFDSSDEKLYADVFESFKCSQEDAVASINHSLKRAGNYIRLYYHLIHLYPEQQLSDEDVRTAMWKVETYRRQLKIRYLSSEDPEFDNSTICELNCAANTILLLTFPLVQLYERSRHDCLSMPLDTTLEQLSRIFNVLSVEKNLFYDDPWLKAKYQKTGEAYRKNVFAGAPQRIGILNVRQYPS